MKDVRHFQDELVLRHAPRAVLLYEGDNDVCRGCHARGDPGPRSTPSPPLIPRNALPNTRMYILAIKPSIRAGIIWEIMSADQRDARRPCREDARLTFIDIATPMLGEDGMPLTGRSS